VWCQQSHTNILPPVHKNPKRGAHAYGLPKLHKDPVFNQPIISGIKSITEEISKIAGYYMKKIIPCSLTHLKDSKMFINEIKNIGVLPPHVKLFRVNAT
jgi:hypothetical protein